MKTVLAILILFIICGTVYSQIEPAKMWTRIYNSGLKDVAVKTAADNDGNLFVAGYRSLTGNSYDTTARMILMKYTPDGALEWSKTFHSRMGRRTVNYSLDVDDSGNAYICGIADTFALTTTRALLVKYSPAGDTLWARYYGINVYPWYFLDVKVDALQNVYTAMQLLTAGGPSSTNTCIAVKYNSSGIFQWETPGITNASHPMLALNNAGDIYFGKEIYANFYDIHISKIDASGVSQWSATYNNPNGSSDILVGMETDPATGDLVTISYAGAGPIQPMEVQTIKFSGALGQIVWAKRTSGTAPNPQNYNTPMQLAVTSAGDVYVCGIFSNTGTNRDGFLIKYAGASGNEMFRKIYNYTGGATDEGFSSVAVNNSGEPVIFGYNSSAKNTFLHRYSPGGSMQWKYTYNDSLEAYNDSSVTVTCLPDGKIYAVAHYSGPTVKDINVTMFDNTGVNTTTICRNINKPIIYGTYIFDSIIVNTGGNRLVKMEITIDSLIHTKPKDLRIYLTTPQGWGRTLFMNSGPDIPGQGLIGTVFSDSASKPIDSGSVTYTGYFMPRNPLEVFNSYNPDGVWTLEIFDVNAPDTGRIYKWCMKITYEAPIGIQTQGNEIPKRFNLSQNYPNPFNPVTNIKFSVPESGIITLKVYDILGRQITELVNEFKPAGNYVVDFSAAELSSGVYFYRLESGEFTDTRKMILIK
jgi:subtilisin-like proprotein convertase family protein